MLKILLFDVQKRRRDLKRREASNQSVNDIELDLISHTLADAFNYVFAQFDIEFFINGEALSNNPGVEKEEIASESSDVFQRPHNEVLIIEAFDIYFDLKTQTSV